MDETQNDQDENSDRQQPTKFSAFVSKYKVVERLKKLSTGSLFNNIPPGQDKKKI